MSENVKVCIVGNDDDWEGMYVNGRLAIEGHSVGLYDALTELTGKTLTGFECRVCDHRWLYDHGNLPDDIGDVKWKEPRP